MRILIVGALSWNPERVRSLHERGHQLWGLWARSMAWDQGPYPSLDDCVRVVPLERAAQTIADERIDCVYALFQIYEPSRWGPAAPGIEHDVWTLLRVLLLERARGTFDAPIVFHFGFDVFRIDRDVVRALDGQVFCNREQLTYWTTPVVDGGAGLDCFSSSGVVGFLDGDRPKLEFMNHDFCEPLSARTGQLHTVCVGRPFNIDYVAMAQYQIHLHVYGNGVDAAAMIIARDLVQRGVTKHVSSIREFVHLHPTRQTSGASWPQVREWKSEWVHEFSRYDAGWSYIASPLALPPLADRSAIPNRLSTYVLACLPVITDYRPGYYRYDELARLGINIDLDVSHYGGLREQLEAEAASGERRRRAVAQREAYSFDASIDTLLGILEQARVHYFTKPAAERRRPLVERDVGAVTGTGLLGRPVTPSCRPPQTLGATRRLARQIRSAVRQRVARTRFRSVARRLQSASVPDSLYEEAG